MQRACCGNAHVLLVMPDEGRFELGLGESWPYMCVDECVRVRGRVQMQTCIFGKAKRRFPAN